MNDPKTFYRELDSLLAKIGKDSKKQNFLSSIFDELEQTFGNQLKITNGCIYELRGAQYIQVYYSGQNVWSEKLDIDSKCIRDVTEHGSFIFDDPEEIRYLRISEASGYLVPAAISIHGTERQWLLVFGLRHGWQREEVTLFLNAVKTALNYRLFSDIIGGELRQAVQIQKSLLPKRRPRFDGFDIYGKSIPAELVGGDFYEYFNFDEGSFGIGIGDASGHGLPAALLVRDVVIGLRMGLASEYKIVYTLKKLNRVIQQSTYSSNFVSLFLGELEQSGHLFYVNAGHPPPFLVDQGRIEDLHATGIVLGYLKNIDLERSYVRLNSNSVLVLYSDGIFERKDTNDVEFGLERLKRLIQRNTDKTAKELVDLVFETVFRFGNSTNWDDDATLVIVKRK